MDGSGLAPGAVAQLCLPGAPGTFPWEAPCRLQVFMGSRWCRRARVTPDCGVYGAQVAFTPSSRCGCNWGWGLHVLQREGSWERPEGPRSALLPDPASPEGQDTAGAGEEQGLVLGTKAGAPARRLPLPPAGSHPALTRRQGLRPQVTPWVCCQWQGVWRSALPTEAPDCRRDCLGVLVTCHGRERFCC